MSDAPARVRAREDDGAADTPSSVREHDAGAALDRTARVFGLAEGARRALAVLLDRTLHGGGRATRIADLVADLGAAATSDAFEPAAPLVRWRLAAVGEGPWSERSVTLVDSFWPRLVGHWPRHVPRAVRQPAGVLDELVLVDAVRSEAHRMVAWMRERRRWPTLQVHGPRASGRATLACAIAAGLELPVLRILGAQLASLGADIVAREAIWQQAAVVIDRGEDAEPAALSALAVLLPAPLVLTTTDVGGSTGVDVCERPIRRLLLPALDGSARAVLWRRSLARAGIEPDLVDIGFFANRFRFGPGQIDEAVEHAGDSERRITRTGLLEVCRAIPDVELGGLARRVDTRHTWADLVVPTKTRRELELIVTWGRDGAALFAGDGPGDRARATRGVACLFWGAPGTGKTLAAQVVARALDRELYRVDLAQVVDKYLGETEKRLDRLFREAESADAVLLFDEADTLFTRRTEVRDARDRYANLETGFMLQRLEEHRGVCILASNARNTLDAAFQRRLLFVVELALPAVAERDGIWRRLLPSHPIPDLDLTFLVDRFAMSGGDIRNAVVTAMLLARREAAPLAMRHLVIAGWRELAKAGRLVDLRELAPWAGAITSFVSEAP